MSRAANLLGATKNKPGPPAEGPGATCTPNDEGRDDQSCGSSLTMFAPWLEPTQNVTGLVELSTNTRRMLVVFGRRYSTNWPLLVSSRTTRSLIIEPVQASSFLSMNT